MLLGMQMHICVYAYIHKRMYERHAKYVFIELRHCLLKQLKAEQL